MFLVILLYALFGSLFTLGKITLFYAKPFFITGALMLIGGSITMAYLYLSNSQKYSIRAQDWTYYLKIGIFGVFLPYCLRAWGLQYMPSTKAAFIFTFFPFSTALLSYLIHKEKLSLQKMIGLLIGFVGMIPTLITTTPLEQLKGSLGFISLPELAVIGAVICFSYNLINVRVLVKERGCPAPLATGMGALIGGFLAFDAALLFERPLSIKDPSIFWPLLFLQIVISNGICLNLQAHLLKEYSPTFLAFAGFLTPIWAAFFGWFFLNEKAYPSYIISFILVLAGLIIFYYDTRAQEAPQKNIR